MSVTVIVDRDRIRDIMNESSQSMKIEMAKSLMNYIRCNFSPSDFGINCPEKPEQAEFEIIEPLKIESPRP